MRNFQLAALTVPILLGSAYAVPRQYIDDRRSPALVERHGGCGPTTYTIITPKPGMKPTAVTKQFQPVFSCIPEYVVCDSKNRKKCETVYQTTSYRWISTQVPCYNGVATITRVDQPVTIAAYPTNTIETCHCKEAGDCYYAATSTRVAKPTSFPYINSGWNYHVCEFSDYYKWYSGDHSPDYSSSTTGGYNSVPERHGESQPSKWHGKGRWNTKNYGKGSSGGKASSGDYGVDTSNHNGKVAYGEGWKSLQVECHSCMNGACSTYPLGLVSKTYVKTTTHQVPYKINRYFPHNTVLCLENYGITTTIYGPTSINIVLTGITTVTSTVTTTETTTATDTATVLATAVPGSPAIAPAEDVFILGADIAVTDITKGQTRARSFVVCANNVCSLRTTCQGAEVFRINTNGQMTNANRAAMAFANNADVASGSALLRLGTGQITQRFSFNGITLVWTVAGAGNNQPAAFCKNADNSLSVVFASGTPPAGCLPVTFFRIDPFSDECLGNLSNGSGTSSTGGPSSTRPANGGPSSTGPGTQGAGSSTGPASTGPSTSRGPSSTGGSTAGGPSSTGPGTGGSSTGPSSTGPSSTGPSSSGPPNTSSSTTPAATGPSTTGTATGPTTTRPPTTTGTGATTAGPTTTGPAVAVVGTEFCDTLEGVNADGLCQNVGDIDPCAIGNILGLSDLQDCQSTNGKVPTNLLGCLTASDAVACIASCRKTFDTVLLAQQCLKDGGSVDDAQIKCAQTSLSGGNDILYRACVVLEGGAPCSPQFIKDQVLEDVTTYLTECAAAGLLSPAVKTCVDTARLNIDVGSGVTGDLGTAANSLVGGLVGDALGGTSVVGGLVGGLQNCVDLLVESTLGG
ncbi:hypothetical protein Dda_8935 [Drechslerella dactyloides]|uniref:DUF7908 domain-containing protein n=1 Tax=Drechslerella dactyloides TaxID=74499 RepID=A0AAD6NFP8_DREDA|nr:hypothetical protein Dda_8935 [Drechslerella dactyloides]